MTCKILADHKPHAVCLPSPYQSHIKSMLKLAKLLHQKGFHITFVNTEFNHKRLLKSRGPDSLKGLPDFRFESVPDGLPPSDENATQDLPGLCEAASKNLLAPFHDLLDKLNDTASPDVPPVTCIVSDGFMPVAITAAEMLGIPIDLFITISACSFMGFKQFQALKEKGLTPLKGRNKENLKLRFQYDILSVFVIYLYLLLVTRSSVGKQSKPFGHITSNLISNCLECLQAEELLHSTRYEFLARSN